MQKARSHPALNFNCKDSSLLVRKATAEPDWIFSNFVRVYERHFQIEKLHNRLFSSNGQTCFDSDLDYVHQIVSLNQMYTLYTCCLFRSPTDKHSTYSPRI
jgi:hypothetical protein